SRGEAEVEFDDDADSEIIYQKVKNKTLKATSVSYRVESWEELMPNKVSADGKFQGPASIARKWLPLEISVVSVPADATVGVGRSMQKLGMSRDSRSIFETQVTINKNKARR
ncbi:MAG: caudovirus prohead protease, partial [Hungatella sp.]